MSEAKYRQKVYLRIIKLLGGQMHPKYMISDYEIKWCRVKGLNPNVCAWCAVQEAIDAAKLAARTHGDAGGSPETSDN